MGVDLAFSTKVQISWSPPIIVVALLVTRVLLRVKVRIIIGIYKLTRAADYEDERLSCDRICFLQPWPTLKLCMDLHTHKRIVECLI